MTSIALVVPADVDTVRSGGNLYDLRLAEALRRADDDVVLCRVEGSWPAVDDSAERRLAAALERLRTEHGHRVLIIDGLVGAACPGVITAAVAAGMDLRLLIHLPLGLEPGLEAETARRRNALEEASVRAAASVIATSNWAAAELCRRHGLQQVAVAPPGVEPAPLAYGSKPPRLLQVGALTPGKNQLALVSALVGVADKPWTACLVGSLTRNPLYVQRVQRAIGEADLGERIILTGELTGAALADQWQAADLSVLPSSVETYGMVVTESLAHGIPVIVPSGTGAEDTLGHDPRGQRPGFAVAAGDPAGLRRVLAQWLRNPATRSAVRRAAENRRAGLTGWDQTARDVAAAVQQKAAR